VAELEERRGALVAHLEAAADELETSSFENVRANSVAYCRGLARDVHEDLAGPHGRDRRSLAPRGPELPRTEWVALLHLLDWQIDAPEVKPLPAARIKELRHRISDQLH
jgi:hypothetical protein